MAASPSSVLTAGLGAWGGVGLLVTRGLGVGAAVIPTVAYFEAACAAQPWLDSAQVSQAPPPWLRSPHAPRPFGKTPR